MSIEVVPFTGDNKAWDDYVLKHGNGTIYHLSAWRTAIEKTFGYRHAYSVAREGARIRGILPLFVIQTLFSGKKIVSIPFAMYGGILADDQAIEMALLGHATELQKKTSADSLELRYLHDPGLTLPRNDLYVTFCKELKATDEELLAAIPRKSRASIRNGYTKFNLTVRHDADVELMYRLYAINKRNLGSPAYPKAFFQHLINEFGENAGILTVYFKDIPVSAVLYFWFKETIIPYFSGADKSYYFTNASNLMYYELMKLARGKGYRYFDFGRSRKGTGAGEFKENMGFTPIQLNYYNQLRQGKRMANISPSNKKFGPMIGLWSKLPLPVTTFLGPKIVKYIP